MRDDLTSIPTVRQWLELQSTTDDELLGTLISGASRMILGYLARDTMFYRSQVDTYNGIDNTFMVLRSWPVLAVSAVACNGVAIPVNPTPPLGSGYVVDTWDGAMPGKNSAIVLTGYTFTRGQRNVSVTYTSGYAIIDEAATIPSGDPYTITPAQTDGNFGGDVGVKTASGTALTKVSAAPATGQYAVSDGVYLFAAADAGQSVLISYNIIPPDIEQACMEIVGERYRYRKRIGEVSRALQGGGSVSFSQKDMSDYVTQLLAPYRAVIPLWQ